MVGSPLRDTGLSLWTEREVISLSEKKLRIGVIGGGGIAQAAHINNYKRFADQAELVAIADIVPEVVDKNVKEHGFQYGFTDFDEMLAKVELDAVSVCVPNKYHTPATIAALKVGCHVLCEKPPAMTGAQAREMAAVAEKAGKILTYGFMNRYTAEAQILKRFVDAGELGNIYTGRVTAMRRSGIPGWGVFTNKELQGGGPLIDIGVHMLDLALYLMGYPKATKVWGVTYQELGNRPMTPTWGGQWDYENFSIEDMALAMIQFDNGATLQLETSFIIHANDDNGNTIRLSGTEGGCAYRPLALFQDKHKTLIDITPAFIPKVDGYRVEIGTFLKAIRGEDEVLCKPHEGVIVQEIIEGIYTSALTGEMVTIS